MATLVLEDFSGQIGGITFPATYEKLKESMVKDTVVQMTGFVMHRENRGEKSIELRIDDIKPLEESLDLGYTGGGGAAGTVKIMIGRATERHMHKFKTIIDEHPGDYQLMIQILPEDSYLPFYAVQHVNPSDTFISAVKSCMTRVDVEVSADGI